MESGEIIVEAIVALWLRVIVDNKVKRTLHMMKGEAVTKNTTSPFCLRNMQVRYALNFSKLLEVFCTTEWCFV